MIAALTEAIVADIGDEAVRSEVADIIADSVTAGAQKVDLIKLLTDLRDKNATITDISQIFDVRMGSRLAAILHQDLLSAVDKVKGEYRGVGAEMAGLMMQGIVGSVARILAALENFAIAAAETGVLDTVANAIDKMAVALTNLAATNPDLLQFGTYAMMVLAAAAPLGFFLAGLASVFTMVASAVSLALSPLGLLVGTMTALAGLFVWNNWEGIKAFGSAFRDSFIANLSPDVIARLEKIKAFFTSSETFKLPIESFQAWGAKFGEWTASVVNGIEGLIQRNGAEFDNVKVGWGLFWEGIAGFPALFASMIAEVQATFSSIGAMASGWADAFVAAINRIIGAVQTLISTIAGIRFPTIGTTDATGLVGSKSQLNAGGSGHYNPANSMNVLGGAESKVGARASGGPVRAGYTYRVNERGEETISMGSRNGFINPANQSKGGVINNTFNITGSDPREIARQVMAVLDRQFGRSAQVSIAGGDAMGK
jgi:hypothetical protein